MCTRVLSTCGGPLIFVLQIVRLLTVAGRGGCPDADALAGHLLAGGVGGSAPDFGAARLHYVAAALEGSLDGCVDLSI